MQWLYLTGGQNQCVQHKETPCTSILGSSGTI